MDDQNFNEKSAAKWISLIEKDPTSPRDGDIYPYINNWLEKSKAKNVLDLGCGQGVCAQKLNLKNTLYSGVDPSVHLLTQAKELNPRMADQFIKGNAYDIPFRNSSFDACFSLAVFHLLAELEKAAAELSRILKPNGKFLIITANSKHIHTWQSSYDKFELQGSQLIGKSLVDGKYEIEDVLYIRPLTEISEAFSKFGLNIVETKDIRMWTTITGMKCQ